MKNQRYRDNLNRRSLLTILLVGCATLLFVVYGVIRWTGELSHGYAAYYTSARLVLDGADPAQFYENRWFREQTLEAGFTETPDIYNVNPPTTALMLVPLAWLSPADADVAWSLLNVAMLAVAVWILLRALAAAGTGIRDNRLLPLLLVGVVLVYHPIYENFRYGQAYILVLLLLSLALLAYVRGNERRLGIWLGLMLVVKSSGVLLWLIPVLDRRFRTLAWGAGTVAVSILAATPLLGIRVWWDYLQWLPSLTNRPWTGVTAYQTTASLVHHLTRAEAQYSPSPLVDARWLAAPLATAVTISLAAAAVVFGWLLARDLPDGQSRLARFGLLSALAIPLQPVGEEHHFVLLLPAVLIALVLVSRRPASGLRGELVLLAVMLGALALAFPLPFKAEALQPGWRALFAYPKLYGALLIAVAYGVWLADHPQTWAARLRQHLASAREWPRSLATVSRGR